MRTASPAEYDPAKDCASLQAASDAATSGDTIRIKPHSGSRYAGQNLTGTKTLSFIGDSTTRPIIGTTIISASNVSFKHVEFYNGISDDPSETLCGNYNAMVLKSCGNGNTFDDVIVDGGMVAYDASERVRKIGLEITGTDTTFKNGIVRRVNNSKGFQGGGDNMHIENTDFEQIQLDADGAAAGVHNECAYVVGGNPQVWSGNRFILCPVQGLFFPNGILEGAGFQATIENNLFTHTVNEAPGFSWHNGPSFFIPSGNGFNNVANWVIRYNTFEVAPQFDGTTTTADNNGSALFYGNLGGDFGCGWPEWTQTYNVGNVCGGGSNGQVSVANAYNTSGNPTQSPFYISEGPPDYNFGLATGTAAVGGGDPSNYPAKDINKIDRTSPPDAGAFKYTGG